MANIDIYKQYFSAECLYNGVMRHGAVVWLNAESADGIIRYEAGVSFFPIGMKKISGSATMPVGRKSCCGQKADAVRSGMHCIWSSCGRRRMRLPGRLAG